MDQPLWKPSQQEIEQSLITKFRRYINKNHSVSINTYSELYAWSVQHLDRFWKAVYEFCDIKAHQSSSTILIPHQEMRKATWFPKMKLNFAENLISRCDAHIAIEFMAENGARRSLSYQQLHTEVTRISNYLKEIGVQAGDRVAGFLPNIPETIIAMLATTSLGAIWSACSPDFGIAGLTDRFSQIEPKVLFAVDGHFYNGKQYHHLTKIQELQNKLPALKKTVLIPYLNSDLKSNTLDNSILFSEIKIKHQQQIPFQQVPFNHPVYILFSSGTTGKPKCIVHGVGGTLIQHKKEMILHCDLRPDDKIFFFTTCSWMMWNWLVSALSVGATIVLYEGAPLYPKAEHLFDLIDEVKITHFGISAKLIELFAKHNLIPKKTHQLNSLRQILSTGSPLLADSFDYIYQSIKNDVCVSSITGGTDIISLFGAGNLTLPVYRNEIQCIGLGMDVKVFNDNGKAVIEEQGELVCTSPFPSMPIYFWNDPDGQKYFDAYFNQFPNVWAHGDYAEISKHGGLIIYGRSDTTLNPSGIRIGTAEIYNQAEKFDEITDCIAVAQLWHGSERIILFVTLKENTKLTEALINQLKTTIRNNLSSHHVPAKIIQVPDLPKTQSGKNMEIVVKKIVNQQPIKNKRAIANPEVLEYFKTLTELQNE